MLLTSVLTGGGANKYLITPEQDPGGPLEFGYSDSTYTGGTYGTLIPANRLYKGATIRGIYTDLEGVGIFDDLVVQLDDAVAGDHFTTIRIRDGDGTFVDFDSSAASTNVTAGGLEWTWGDGANPVWSAGRLASGIIIFI